MLMLMQMQCNYGAKHLRCYRKVDRLFLPGKKGDIGRPVVGVLEPGGVYNGTSERCCVLEPPVVCRADTRCILVRAERPYV
jgi:hypothetical protein